MENPHAQVWFPVNFSDHFIVASAASDRSAVLIHSDLEDRSGVVGHSAHQSRIESDLEFCGLHGIDTVDDGLQAVCVLFVKESLKFLTAVLYACGIRGDLLEHFQVFLYGLFCKAGFLELFGNALKTDFIHLIEDNKYGVIGLSGNPL